MKTSVVLALMMVLGSVSVYADSPAEDPFDPALVIWDPGTIQNKNDQGQWTITLDHRTITQADIPTLSPLEIEQAVEVLTERHYPIEFVLDHLEQFRALITVDPRG